MESPCRLCSHTPSLLDLLQEQSLREPLHYSNSTIPDLLKSNDPPYETKSKEIQAILAEQNGKLAEIEAKMAQVQQQLAVLFAERTRVQQKILDCKAIVHPIRRVPGDVLGEIFTRLINEDVSQDEETCSYDPKVVIWSLSQVSRQWRNSALSFPRLWSMFQFCPNLQELHGHPRFYSAMKMPFSQIRELDGSLSYAHSDDYSELTCLPNLHHLSLSPEDNDETGVNHPEITLSCLSSLVLWRVTAGPIHLLKYLQSPSLNLLGINRLDRVCDLVPFLQRSNSLTSLSIRSLSFTDKDCIQILEATPSLTHLMFNCPLIYTDEFVNRLIGDDDTPRLVPSLAVFDVRGDVGFTENRAMRLREGCPELKLFNLGEFWQFTLFRKCDLRG